MSKTLDWLTKQTSVDLIKTPFGTKVETVTMSNSNFNLMLEQVRNLEEENERMKRIIESNAHVIDEHF